AEESPRTFRCSSVTEGPTHDTPTDQMTASATGGTMRWQAIILLMLSEAVAGCGSSSTTPATAPSSPSPPQVQLAVFHAPSSTFATSDVRDVQGQIVRFDLATNSLIWAVDGRSFSGYAIDGNFIRSDHAFQVRFGTDEGERRAYFTETVKGTICDIEVTGGQLVLTSTNVMVPGS